MIYDIYKSARDKSWQCLIQCNVKELPVRPVAVAKYYGITCHPATSEAIQGSSGVLRTIDGKPHIFTNDSHSIQRRRFSVAHELGHYLLGHLDGIPSCNDREYAAERFAADLLMPACVLWGLNIHSAEDIARICNVSEQAAKIRAERMNVLYKRNMFLTHPLECRVYQQFSDFIQKNKH